MIKPEECILKVWDLMCAKSNKSLKNDFPLLEDECIVEIDKYLKSLEEYILKLDNSLEK